MRLESGPAKADSVWQLVRAVLFLGFAAYFVYDGAVGYPNRNRAEAERALAADPFGGRVKVDGLGEVPDRADFEKFRKTYPASATLEQVHDGFGTPTLVDRPYEYFVSRYGYAQITVVPGTNISTGAMTFKPWAKSKEEIQQQYLWAIVPLIPGLWFLWRLFKAVTLRVVIDDEGMTYGGQRIAFADMVSLRDYSPKGWIDLYYKVPGGTDELKLRLDNEKVLLFDDIVAAICEAKHFKNEVQAYADQKARDRAESEPAADEPDAPDDAPKA